MNSFKSGIKGFLSNDELAVLRQGKFELHCLQMRLKQLSNEGRVFSGPGVIKQAADGQLQFTLYAKEMVPLDELITGMPDIQPGQIMPEHVFFQLSAKDFNGREWTSNRVFPSKHTVQGGTLCTGELVEITHKANRQAPTKHNHIYLEVYDDIEIPANTRSTVTKTIAGQELSSSSLNVLRFDTDNYELILQKEANSLQITTFAKGMQLEDYFEMRLAEALQFVVARPIFWSVMQKRTSKSWEIRIRGSRSTELRSRIEPPLSISPDATESFRRMFESYLKYVLIADLGEKLHPISAQMRAICHASAGAIEAEALTLCVAIESILKHVHTSRYELSPEDKDWIEKAKDYFASWEGPRNLGKRITGLFSMLYAPSAKTRLRELVEMQAITDQQKQGWDRLRHKLAHGETLGSASLQEFLDLTNTVLVLFYHLVFYAIGYRGKYTDYSLPGWPTKDYSAPVGATSTADNVAKAE